MLALQCPVFSRETFSCEAGSPDSESQGYSGVWYMSEDQRKDGNLARLPKEFGDRLKKPFSRFLEIEAAGGSVLLLFTVIAVILSNSPWADSYLHAWEARVGFQVGSWEYARSLKEWINDGLMTLFFFLVALELKRELVLGELNNPRVAALSIAAALGGMLVPAALYLMLQWGQPGQDGWGTVMATDTAFVIACLALLGSRVPHSLRVFMLSLAIVDDIGAILVVAIGYSSQLDWSALALGVLGVAVVHMMALAGFRTFPVYFLVGMLTWLAVDASGIHATVTGVIFGLMTPARRWVSDKRLYAILDKVVAHPSNAAGSGDTRDRDTLRVAEIAVRETLSPVERLEIGLHPWVSLFIMPLFALANAGLTLSLSELSLSELSLSEIAGSVTLSVFSGFVIGKPAGILILTWLAIRTGIAVRPPDLDWRAIVGGSLLAGIGFTMALFIANLAFMESLMNSVKLGIFAASVVSAVAGLAVLYWGGRAKHEQV